ncbi:MAG: glycosyltransferase family 39 protein, partial [Acidobacteria bacterium]|nr:glycosyltransferase family 39 protein [Acidobacteriota bacterium]
AYTWVLVFPLEINPLYFVGPISLLEERLPFVICGFLLGFSLWHVARRLYGNTGGYIALALYSFSPLIIFASATVGHDVIAAWGLFGAVFTAIALSHTLLAPPMDRIRRMLLLGVALGMGIGADYTVAIVLPVALALMLYVAPERRTAALAWLAAAATVAVLLLWAVFSFDAGAMITALRQAHFFELRPAVVAGGIPYETLVAWFTATLPALALFGVALAAFARSRRSRYFSNVLPLLMGGALFLMSLATPYYLSAKYLLWALPFLYLFGAGVFADLLEEPRSRAWTRAVLVAVLVLHALGCLCFLISPLVIT